MVEKKEKMLRVMQAANRLYVSDKTVYRWLDEGKVFDANKIIRINGSPRIPESEVERVLKGE